MREWLGSCVDIESAVVEDQASRGNIFSYSTDPACAVHLDFWGLSGGLQDVEQSQEQSLQVFRGAFLSNQLLQYFRVLNPLCLWDYIATDR